MKLLSRVRLFAVQWTVAYQAPPPMWFSRQEYWGGLPFPSSGHLPDPGIKPGSPMLQADALPSEPPGKPSRPHFVYSSENLLYNTGSSAQCSSIDGHLGCLHLWAIMNNGVINIGGQLSAWVTWSKVGHEFHLGVDVEDGWAYEVLRGQGQTQLYSFSWSVLQQLFIKHHNARNWGSKVGEIKHCSLLSKTLFSRY